MTNKEKLKAAQDGLEIAESYMKDAKERYLRFKSLHQGLVLEVDKLWDKVYYPDGTER